MEHFLRIGAHISIVLLYCFCFFSCRLVFAEIVVLKSGKEIEGEIIEKTKDFIQIQTSAGALYFMNRYIKEIKESPVLNVDVHETADIDLSSQLQEGFEYASRGEFVAAERAFLKGLPLEYVDLIDALNLLHDVGQGGCSKEYAINVFKGFMYLKQQKYNDALVPLYEALKIQPEDPQVSYQIALIHFLLGEYGQTISSLERVLQYAPEYIEAYYMLGNAYYLNGQFTPSQKAFAITKELLRKTGDFARADEVEKYSNELFSSLPGN